MNILRPDLEALVSAQKASPYLRFSREDWSTFRDDTPMTLSEEELSRLRGFNSPTSISEVDTIYRPLARLLGLYYNASQELYKTTAHFLRTPGAKVPYLIGVAGSVAVGKSTTSRILKALLSRWREGMRVELVTTDGFLYPNSVLRQKGIMTRKGFPESYDLKKLVHFLSDLKSGASQLQVPIYSHSSYDILEGQYQIIDQPEIIIIEGLNILQSIKAKKGNMPQVFVSDFLDFSIYLHAPLGSLKEWYVTRFMYFREKAKNDPTQYFHRFSQLSDEEAQLLAEGIWTQTNEVNLLQNIQPYKERAQLILHKGAGHAIEEAYLRKN